MGTLSCHLDLVGHLTSEQKRLIAVAKHINYLFISNLPSTVSSWHVSTHFLVYDEQKYFGSRSR